MENSSKSGLILYYFRGNWCKTCTSFDPVYYQFKAQMTNFARTEVIDVDTDKTLVHKYNVTSVPTVILVKDGEEVDKNVGQMSVRRLNNMIAAHL